MGEQPVVGKTYYAKQEPYYETYVKKVYENPQGELRVQFNIYDSVIDIYSMDIKATCELHTFIQHHQLIKPSNYDGSLAKL